MGKLDVESKKIYTLIQERIFHIPNYQRFYSWKKENLEDFFSDIEKLMKPTESNRTHFMATIVCQLEDSARKINVKTTDYEIHNIVDGQQRITTLIILLKEIERALEDEEIKAEIKKVLVKDKKDLVLLQINNQNQDIFNQFLKEDQFEVPGKADIKYKKDTGEFTHAEENLYVAIRGCRDFVEKFKSENEENLLKLLSLIKNSIEVVVYDIPEGNPGAVFDIFEVLNSRGVPVDPLDKCKTMLMGRASEFRAGKDIFIELENTWANIYKSLFKNNIYGSDILRITATLRHGAHQGSVWNAEEGIEQLRKECNESKSAEITTEISKSIKKIIEHISNLESKFFRSVTKVIHARILAVAIMQLKDLPDRQFGDKEIDGLLDQWERVTFRIFGLCRKDSRFKKGDYLRRVTMITEAKKQKEELTYKGLLSEIKEIGKEKEYSIGKAVEEGLREKNIYEKPEIAKYILWSYEEHLAKENGIRIDEEKRNRYRNMSPYKSIEHIHPQKDEGGAWENFDDDNHIQRIGNLILLPPEINLEASTKSFEEKKKIYEKADLHMVKEILQKKQWTLNEIEDREEKIIKWALEKWADKERD